MQIIPRTVFSNLQTALPDRRVIVITGMRRVGKTTTLHWLVEAKTRRDASGFAKLMAGGQPTFGWFY